MKIKKIILIIIILMMIPAKVFAWLPYTTYEACNKINIYLSLFLQAVAILIALSYITFAISYIRYSKKTRKEKFKNIYKWFIIVLLQILILQMESFCIQKVGMELYWHPSGERYQFKEIDGYISNGIRITAFVPIIAYIITAISYFIKSKKEKEEKIKKLIKWQVITATVVAVLLILARNW